MSPFGFSSDSVFTIQSLGRDWPHLREHDPPYVRKQKRRHGEHEDSHASAHDAGPAVEESDTDEAETGSKTDGFEVTV
jgi:hypothetical protein